jgi:cytochrome c biogenesis protein CcdA
MYEELFVAFMIGISFSNAFVCMLMGFGTTAVERRNTGKYFILGRFLGVMALGLIIASLGVVMVGFMDYFIIIFGISTILFGAVMIFKIYTRYKARKMKTIQNSCGDSTACETCPSSSENQCVSDCNSDTGACEHSSCEIRGKDLTKQYSFILGVLRGATPCLKIFILTPLLIIVDLQLAFLMILIYASASTVYPMIGFISANIITNFRKYEPYIQTTGAFVLISIGVYTIVKYLLTPACPIGL